MTSYPEKNYDHFASWTAAHNQIIGTHSTVLILTQMEIIESKLISFYTTKPKPRSKRNKRKKYIVRHALSKPQIFFICVFLLSLGRAIEYSLPNNTRTLSDVLHIQQNNAQIIGSPLPPQKTPPPKAYIQIPELFQSQNVLDHQDKLLNATAIFPSYNIKIIKQPLFMDVLRHVLPTYTEMCWIGADKCLPFSFVMMLFCEIVESFLKKIGINL